MAVLGQKIVCLEGLVPEFVCLVVLGQVVLFSDFRSRGCLFWCLGSKFCLSSGIGSSGCLFGEVRSRGCLFSDVGS